MNDFSKEALSHLQFKHVEWCEAVGDHPDEADSAYSLGYDAILIASVQAARIEAIEAALSDTTDALELANTLLAQKLAVPLTNQFNARHAAAERARALLKKETDQ